MKKKYQGKIQKNFDFFTFARRILNLSFMNYKINLFFYDYNFCDFLTLFINSKSLVKIPATPSLKYLFAILIIEGRENNGMHKMIFLC
ncbi:Uncharacterised protein [Chlamydia trachomatis]|nr:Uncharacterised protein [Chlamydia trachomatis]